MVAKSGLSRFRSLLPKAKVDGFLVTNPVNRNYLSGFSGSAGNLLLTPKNTYFITDSRYTIQAKAQVKDAKLVHQTSGPLVHVADLVKKDKVRRLGFEAQHVTVATHQALAKALPRVPLVPLSGLAEDLRLVKDEAEKVVMRKAASIADRAFRGLLPRIKAGRQIGRASCRERGEIS